MKKATQAKPDVASVPVSEVRRKDSLAARDHVPAKKAKAPKALHAPKKPAKKAADGAKRDTIMKMLKAPGGATSVDIGKAVGWLPNSIRGFFWSLKGKDIVVTTVKEKGKPTVYSIVEPKGAKAAAQPQVGDVI